MSEQCGLTGELGSTAAGQTRWVRAVQLWHWAEPRAAAALTGRVTAGSVPCWISGSALCSG